MISLSLFHTPLVLNYWRREFHRGIAFLCIFFAACAPQRVTPRPSLSDVGKRQYYTDSISSFIWPITGQIISSFGDTIGNIKNKGIDIKTKTNISVVASEAGRVVFSDHLKGWGKTIIIEHTDNYHTVYAHLKDVFVREGRYLKKGEALGDLPYSQEGDGYILHFEIRKQHLALDPLKILMH